MKNIVVLDKIFVGEDWKSKSITDDVVCRCLVCGGEKVMSIKQALKYYEHRNPQYSKVPICDNCTAGKVTRNGLIPQSIKSDTSITTMKEIYTGLEDVVTEYFSNEMSTTVYATKCTECGKKYYDTYNTIVRKGVFVCTSCHQRGVYAEKLGHKSLSVRVPNIDKYWSEKNEKQPSEIRLRDSSREKFYTICPLCGKENHKRYDAILRSGPYCGPCAKRVNVPEDETLRYLYPRVADMYDNSERNKLSSEKIRATAHGEFYFKCPDCSNIFKKSLINMVAADKKQYSMATGCPICAGHEVRKGYNDITSGKNPLALEYWDYDKNSADGLNPEEVSYKSISKAWFKCGEGHSFYRSIHKLLEIGDGAYGKGCPICAGRQVLVGVNDVATTHKEILNRWDYERNEKLGISPEDVTAGSNKEIWVRCKICNESYKTTVYNAANDMVICCENCRKRNYSIAEKELVQYIRDLGFTVEEEVRIAGNYSVDMVIPEKGIAIDYNGLYWHSDRYRDKWYHYNKMVLCRDRVGLDLYYIWEDWYKERPDIVKSWLRNLLGKSNDIKIGARECKAGYVNTASAIDFLNKRHIQGSVSCSYYMALYKEGIGIAALMAYSVTSKGLYIQRYCTSCKVQGGFSKLLNEVLKTVNVDTVYTFSDNSISSGSLYASTGFIIDSELNPDYSYLVGNKREHKFNYRKARFEKDKNLYYEDGMTEKELAEVNGLYRVYDAGKVRWVKYLK